ncbi:hypothetical protein [Flavobacterium sp.]|uniref:LA_2272 family surface repeat-containing protein n=1 Tax=Flavobacterium sp. TaxID=239 RepID=UPI0026222EAA|nr:hypothetical protein [Flavobacterium sp.]
MKLQFVAFFILLFSNTILAQDTITVTTDNRPEALAREQTENKSPRDSVRIFSISPIHSRVKKVNGLTLGAGHFENTRIKLQEVNGLNIEASPIALALITFGLGITIEGFFVAVRKDPFESYSLTRTFLKQDGDRLSTRINGLNISSGGFLQGGAQVNGLNICVVSVMNKMNGVSVTGAILSAGKMNGISVCGIANIAETGNGLQLAISNVAKDYRGLQIGLFNNAKNLRGVQFGLWNTNGKRRLPFVNWQFKS